MAIYYIPYAASGTSTSGSQSNPNYKSAINSKYQSTLLKSSYSILDYKEAYPDFRKLFYALTGETATLTEYEKNRLETQYPTTTSKSEDESESES